MTSKYQPAIPQQAGKSSVQLFSDFACSAKRSCTGNYQPLGVSTYQLSKFVPEHFKGSLPTIDEIEAELSV